MLIRAGRSFFQHEHMTRMVDATFPSADHVRDVVYTLTLYFSGEQAPVILRDTDRLQALQDLRDIYEHEQRQRNYSKDLETKHEDFFRAMKDHVDEGADDDFVEDLDNGETEEEG